MSRPTPPDFVPETNAGRAVHTIGAVYDRGVPPAEHDGLGEVERSSRLRHEVCMFCALFAEIQVAAAAATVAEFGVVETAGP